MLNDDRVQLFSNACLWYMAHPWGLGPPGLQAQNIPPDKASKVLNDVARTMFDKEYMEKLFTPQVGLLLLNPLPQPEKAVVVDR